ncbi:Imidazolonepropionase [Aquicella siphonis]|uniref:Imidazolonepropionase n=1 Tax=Aquicella siphonis TaxID=254247 RepID=A0A5E4PJI6_9COXI|nr:imidazolonepropionase [Aquicella siphonis]VVC77249.1 Imidazolonepropionase [Aquicella siphonis]
MRKQYDAIWLNAQIATCEQGYGLIQQAGIAVRDGRIAWVGPVAELPYDPEKLAAVIHDCNGRCLTPGLIDCHTHLVFAGNRAHEFEMRLQGATYEEIARQGGGIQSTVSATRSASEEVLFQQSLARARDLQKSGVTTLEIKSGYGLDWPTELKMLRVAKRIEDTLPLTVSKTFLGAHTFPPEFRSNPDAYVDLLCQEMIPVVAREQLADAVDVFCEKIAFSLEQTKRVFASAAEHGLKVKCHAEQLSDMGGTTLAASYQALSVDHLEHVGVPGVKALEQSGSVAVLLPGAFYFLRETKLPPVELLRRHRIPIAVATDCNPGTSPVTSLLMIMNMACTLFRLTPSEALEAVTRHAAQALGMSALRGTLTAGKAADMAVWEVSHPAELVYYLGNNPLRQLIRQGKVVF